MEIKDILKPEELRDLTQFTAKEQDWLNKRIHTRKDGKPGVECVVRGLNTDGDYFELKPEEVVRQLYAHRLMEKYKYPKELLEFEVPAMFAGKSYIDDKRIDIAIYSDKTKKKFTFVIEVKRPEVKDENAHYGTESTTPYEQMNSYCSNKHAEVGVIANGANLCKFYSKKDDYKNTLSISKFPAYGEDLDEWLESRRFTLKQLMQEDRLETETLKDIILNVEQRFAANESSDKEFEEIFKLIFTKLYDEKMSSDDADEISNQIKYTGKKLADIDDSGFRVLDFCAREGESLDDIFKRIEGLFQSAKNKWPGVFPDDSKLNMKKVTVKSCVKELQSVKLFNSNLEVVDDAFEHLINLNQKKEMSQFFTPRYVIDMCVKMLNPTSKEKMIDTAAGSCGFPMHTIFHVWEELNPSAPNLFTTTNRTQTEQDYVRDNVFGIDFSEPSVRIGRMLNIIAGDGHTNIIELNTLDFLRWDDEYVHNPEWLAKYNEGFQKLKKLQTKGSALPYKAYDFDIVMANPPFSGDLDNLEQLAEYEFSKNAKGVQQAKANKAILFLERNLLFLKPGGRMAIVLPQGIFNNSGLQYIREAVLDKCRLLAVVGLHGNVFKPHTGTKTSVLLVQKWTDDSCDYPNICPKPVADADGNIDYPIFFATMQKASKNNSGEKIYVTENYVKWTNYSYFTERTYTRKSDFKLVSKEEYDKAKKKSDYWVKDKNGYTLTEHTNSDGETRFIKDLFIDEYGDLDSHRKWIRKNVCFVLKNKKANPTAKPEISMVDFFKLDAAAQSLYKEQPILGDNTNPLITKDEYDALPAEEKKYYLVAEEIIESSERIKDTHGHIFVKHDLFNQDPQLQNKNPHNIYAQNGIVEAFAKFAYDEHLSFAPSDEELQRILHPENELPF